MATRKLISRKGTLLGTITFNDGWDNILRERGAMQFAYMERPDFLHPVADHLLQSAIGMSNIKNVTIERSWFYEFPDGVHLHSMTPEEFERMPGCSFSPSAAYIRSLVEGR